MDDYVMVELTKLGGNGYGIILWKDEESRHLFYIIEPIIKRGHFDLVRRDVSEGKVEYFRKDFDVKSGKELDEVLYEKAKEIAVEKSRLHKILFVDSARK